MIFRFPIFFLILLEVAVRMQMSQHRPADAGSYIEKEDLVYLLSSIPVTLHEVCGNKAEPMKKQVLMLDESYLYVRFEPKYLDFNERYLGIPYQMKVTIVNVHHNRTLHLQSISGSTLDFCSSFFEDTIIPPQKNTTFNVVLLGREEGEIETNLYIHTSEGIFKFKVRGMIVQNPYRVRPIISQLPINASFAPTIAIHNPYPLPLQLVEVFKSDGEVSLELPSGDLPAPRTSWEIPAYLTKPILKVRYNAMEHKNHTSYIRLKVNNSDEVLVVPIGVEVTPQPGLYSEEDVIDFGVGGSLDPESKVQLYLRNSNKKQIKILGIVPVPSSDFLVVDFDPIKVPPDTVEPFYVATLTFNWNAAHKAKKCCGSILIRTQGHGRLLLNYTAKVFEGGLTYDDAVTKFKIQNQVRFSPRHFMLSNAFKFPLVITSAALHPEAVQYFEISNFHPVVMQPSENRTLFSLQFKPNAVLPLNNFRTSVVIQSNVSAVTVPLYCYSGRLTKVTLKGGHPIDMGLIGSDTRKDTYIAFMNENPVPILLTTWGTNLTTVALEYLGTEKGNASSFLTKYHSFYNLTKSMSVLPGHYAVLRVSVFTTKTEGVQYGSVWLKTDYERATLSLKMTLAKGSLDVVPDPVYIKHCFPGKMCKEPLRISSSFKTPMSVLSVSAGIPNHHFAFEKSVEALISPGVVSSIGNLSYYIPELHFLGIHTDDRGEAGSIKWIDTLSLPSNTRDFDIENIKLQNVEFKNMLLKKINLTLRLETSLVSGFMFRASVTMSRAAITKDRNVHFPLTQIGNTSYRNITLFNPFETHVLRVHLVLEKHYPYSSSIVEEIPDSLKPSCRNDCYGHTSPQEFGFEKIHQDSHVLSSPIHSVHKDTPFYVIRPGENVTVNLAFAPTLSQRSSALLFIRNDKTVLETVMLSGVGALVQFDFANRKPGSSTPITFSYERKHVDECDNYRSMMELKSGTKPTKKRRSPLEHLTIMRSFSARNTGELPIEVLGFAINGIRCQGYGFKVLNCRNFTLAPNSSRKIDISFTPDLTLTKVIRTLSIETNMAPSACANYTLEVSLSVDLLEACAPLQARPPWEHPVYWTMCMAIVIIFLFTLTSAYLDARHICDTSSSTPVLVCATQDPAVQPVLDLRKIGTGVGLKPSNVAPDASKVSSPSSSSTFCPPMSSSSSLARIRRFASGMTRNYFSATNYTHKDKPKYSAPPPTSSSSSSSLNNSFDGISLSSRSGNATTTPSPAQNGSLGGLRKRNVVSSNVKKTPPCSPPGSHSHEELGGSGTVPPATPPSLASSQVEELKKEVGTTSSCAAVTSSPSTWANLFTKSNVKSNSPSPPTVASVSSGGGVGNNSNTNSSQLNNTSVASTKLNKQSKAPPNNISVINNHKLINYIKKNETLNKRNLLDFNNTTNKSNNNKKFNAKQNNNSNNTSKKESQSQNHKRNISDASVEMQDSFSSDDGKSSPNSIDHQKENRSSNTTTANTPSPHHLMSGSTTPVSSSSLKQSSGPGDGVPPQQPHSVAQQLNSGKSSVLNKASTGGNGGGTGGKKQLKAIINSDVFTANNIFDPKVTNTKAAVSVVNKKSAKEGKLKKSPNDQQPTSLSPAPTSQKSPLVKCKSSPVKLMMEEKPNNLDKSLNNNSGGNKKTNNVTAASDEVTPSSMKINNLNNNAHQANLSSLPSILNHPLYSALLEGTTMRSFMESQENAGGVTHDSFYELSDSSVGSPPNHSNLGPIGPKKPLVTRTPSDKDWGHWVNDIKMELPAGSGDTTFRSQYFNQESTNQTQTTSYENSTLNSGGGWSNNLGSSLLLDNPNTSSSFTQQTAQTYSTTQSNYEEWPQVPPNTLWGDTSLYSSSDPMWNSDVWTPPVWTHPPPNVSSAGGGSGSHPVNPPPGFSHLPPPLSSINLSQPPPPPLSVEAALRLSAAAAVSNTNQFPLDASAGQDYHPFRSLSSIWNPHSEDIWKPYTSNQPE